jgi:hypothetical protein
MKPTILIRGYSAQSPSGDHTSVTQIFGNLPHDLAQLYDVVEIDLSRYVSKACFEFRWKDRFSLSLIPRLRANFTTRPFRRKTPRPRIFCSTCDPHFCSIKITKGRQEVCGRTTAEGKASVASDLKQQAREFPQVRTEMYAWY